MKDKVQTKEMKKMVRMHNAKQQRGREFTQGIKIQGKEIKKITQETIL